MTMPLASSFGALCTDFYVNQKLGLKMDLPSSRQTVLDLFDRVRRDLPRMDRFRRFEDELALESPEEDSEYNWLALNRTSIRSGWVNPESLDTAYRLHRMILEIAPYYLSISPIDVEFVELLFGFDIEADANRNAVVFEALFANSPLYDLVEDAREPLIDIQPFLGFSLTTSCDIQAFVEIKTRTRTHEIARGAWEKEPISVYLTVRRYGPYDDLDNFNECFGVLAGHIERLAEDRVIPQVVVPIRHAAFGSA